MNNIKRKLAITLSLLVTFIASINSQSQVVKNDRLKDWSIQNTINRRFIVDRLSAGKPILQSPDGKYFFFVTSRLNLKNDRVDYKLNIYNTEEVLSALNSKKTSNNFYVKPLRTVTLSTIIFIPDYGPKNSGLKWTDDSKSILFTGTDAFAGGTDVTDESKLFKYNMVDGSLELIKSIDNTNGYIRRVSNCTSDASTLIFTTKNYIPSPKRQYQYPESAITNFDLLDLFFGYSKEKFTDYLYRKNKISELPENDNTWLSPDGSKLIISQPRKDFPYSWSDYYKVSPKPFSPVNTGNFVPKFSRFMLIDANAPETLHPLMEAPSGENTVVGSQFNNLTNVLFTADNKYAILVNSSLPLKENQSKPDTMSYIVAVNLENGSYQTLSPLIVQQDTVNSVIWNRGGNELVVSFKDGKNTKAIGYKRSGSKWTENTSPEIEKSSELQLPDGLKIFIRQDANTPPMMIASKGKTEIYLTEPDSALENVYIAPAKEISWKMQDGRTLTGGLWLPRGYEKMKPLPLIVENYGYDLNKFNPDDGGTGYLTQSFTANGYAVLKLDIALDDFNKKYGSYNSKNEMEGPHYVEMVDAAVKILVDSGLADPNKIGTIGFSRGGYETLYAITHPGKTKFAVAIANDCFTGTFNGYLISPNHSEEHLYNGSFWKNKASWLEHEPLFNLDRVKTPLFLSFHTSGEDPNFGIIQYADLFGAFDANKNPLEVSIYPKGTHSLSRPKEMYSSIISVMDWMNFWLKGIEDSDPTKADKYERWHEFRKMQDAVLNRAQVK